MILFLQRALKCFLALIIVLVAAFSFYDIFYFQPHRSQINEIYEAANAEDKNPPETVRVFIKARHTPRYADAAKLLIIKLNILKPEDGQRQWHINKVLWSAFVLLHIPTQEIYGLICTLSYNGKDEGINALAERVFLKPLSKLSNSEAATVVAILDNPTRYLHSPGALKKHRDMFIKRAGSSEGEQ